MDGLRFLSKAEQVAAFLRKELEAGRWEGLMPGRLELAAKLGLNARTVEGALRQLELEGVLAPQGAGRRRRIVRAAKSPAVKGLRIQILLYEKTDRGRSYQVDMLHRLKDAGHSPVFADRSLSELGMDPARVADFVKRKRADAWIVGSGSQEVLDWFVRKRIPVFAQFGRFSDLAVPAMGVRKIPAMKAAVRRLVELGHRRIVMMVREERRRPKPGPFEQAFLDELEAHGIATGPYHLPDWEDSTVGFHSSLDGLFGLTPPTALILSESSLFVAAQLHLARQGISAPGDISLICDDPDAAFSWCQPPVSHFHWDGRPVVSRIVRWADRVARGVEDKKHRYTLASFVEGGTIGPAKG